MRSVMVLGGSGFIGRSLVKRLVKAGYHVIVPTRRREKVKQDLIVLPNTDVVATDPFEPSALSKLLKTSDIVINLVGILHETKQHSFETVHVENVRRLVDTISNTDRVRQLIHISALNATPGAPSRYLRSKGKGEAFVSKTNRGHWTIIRPSIVFGNGDGFFGLFSKLLRWFPLMLLPRPNARLQPIYVENLVDVIVGCISNSKAYDQTLSVAGPNKLSLRELVVILMECRGPRRPLFGLGDGVAKLLAGFLEHVPFLPPLLTRDNLASLSVASECDAASNVAAQYAPEGKLISVREYLLTTRGRRSQPELYSEFRHVARRG